MQFPVRIAGAKRMEYDQALQKTGVLLAAFSNSEDQFGIMRSWA
jgi:hypothetical protein